MNLQDYKVHFIGIGGISMSGIAQILLHDGCRVTGSDRDASPMTQRLSSLGATIFIGHDAKNITDQSLVVYTAAIKADNPELLRAKKLGIPTMDRAEMLGLIMKNYDVPIAVSGTHGKTTTTAMLAQIFLESDTDPTVSIGGELDSIGGNIRVGGKQYFITEACEYHKSFLRFFPTLSIILNIEADHLDFYKDLDEIIETFHALTTLTPPDGAVIVNGDDPNVARALVGSDCRILTFGFGEDCAYRAVSLAQNEHNAYSFELQKNGTPYASLSLSVPGKHSVYDALAAFAAADVLGLSPDVIAAGLARYDGTHRRFEHKGTCNGAAVVDDYAHHPTEIRATLTAASEMGYSRIWCVFQPHTYTRTKTLFDEFVAVFRSFDLELIITDIFAAREKDTGLVSAKQLADAIGTALYIPSFEEIEQHLRQHAQPGDLILTMGAGNVVKIGEAIVD